MLVSISSNDSLLKFDIVTSSFIVSIFILPQISPDITVKSLNISGVMEYRKYPNSNLSCAIINLLSVITNTDVEIISYQLSFLCPVNTYKTVSSSFKCFSAI